MKHSLWILFAAVLLAGNVCVHLTATQPLSQRIESLTAQVTTLQAGIDRLTASAGTATQANDLLASLTVQGERTRQAQEAIEQIRRFERDVRAQGLAAGHSRNLVHNIGQLHEELLAQGQQLADLNGSVDDLSAFQQQVHGLASSASREYADVDRAMQLVRELGRLKQDVAAQAKDIDTAVGSLQLLADLKERVASEAADVDQAAKSLRQLGELKERVATEADGIDLAEAQFARLIGLKKSVELIDERQLEMAESRVADLSHLKNLIIAGGRDVASAIGFSNQLLSLQDDLVSHSGHIDVARKHADGLLSLEDALSAETELAHAQDNLEAFQSLGRQLAAQDEQIIAAVEALELMSDLQAEFVERISRLEGVRVGLTELALLESSILRTVRALEPLAELTSLRRLTGDDLQAMARGLLSRRASRIAAADPNDPTQFHDGRAAVPMGTNAPGETLVPIPPTDD